MTLSAPSRASRPIGCPHEQYTSTVPQPVISENSEDPLSKAYQGLTYEVHPSVKYIPQNSKK